MDTYTLVWSAGIIGALVSAVGGAWYISALRKIGGMFKESQKYILFASSSWTLYSILMLVLALMRIPLESTVWYIIPVAYTITAIFFITGTYKLMVVLQEMNK